MKYFKIYASREYSVENVIFFEEVSIFKTLNENKKEIRAKEMGKIFFEPDSIHEINTSKSLISIVLQDIQDGKICEYLFDIVLRDVIQNNLSDTFQRFVISDLYVEMKKKTKKKNIFCLNNMFVIVNKIFFIISTLL